MVEGQGHTLRLNYKTIINGACLGHKTNVCMYFKIISQNCTFKTFLPVD